MLTELRGKGGVVCTAARSGAIRCPLIIRPTSEDVVTGELFGALSCLNPRWWLPDLLNAGLGAERFRKQLFRGLKIELWRNRPPYPRELLPWTEGSTQVDVTISWRNPPTTVLVEVKYCAELSTSTTRNNGEHGFPSDQLTRTLRVGLLETGWLQPPQIVSTPRRDLVVLFLSAADGHELVDEYRDGKRVGEAVPRSDLLEGLPAAPFVGHLSYRQVVEVLARQRRWFSLAERKLIDQLLEYLTLKIATRPGTTST